eukprot:201494_1
MANGSEIRFYNKKEPYYEFSNFWGTHTDKKFTLRIDNREWPSSEHYYQAQKFAHRLDDKDYKKYFNLIADAPTPSKCFTLATQRTRGGYATKWIYSKTNPTKLNEIVKQYRNKQVTMRDDWDKVKDHIMLKALRFKFKQNLHLKKLLLSTGDALLIEHTKRDCYWGDGGDGTGQNKLGLSLMEVRNELKSKANVSQNHNKKRKMQESLLEVEPPHKKRKMSTTDDRDAIQNNNHNKKEKVSLRNDEKCRKYEQYNEDELKKKESIVRIATEEDMACFLNLNRSYFVA